MRGFFPAVALAVLWAFSLGSWMMLLEGRPNGWRIFLGRGVIQYNWPTTANWKLVGKQDWSIGSSLRVHGKLVRWYVRRPLWSLSYAQRMDWRLVLIAGHVNVPVFYFVGLALAPAVVWRVVAWLRLKPAWACQACGYDRRATPAGDPCPECGAEASVGLSS